MFHGSATSDEIEIVKKSKSLKKIKFSHIVISMEILNALSVNKSVENFSCDDCEIATIEQIALLRMINFSNNITTFDLKRQEFSEYNRLVEVIESTKVLNNIMMKSIPGRSIINIIKALMKNTSIVFVEFRYSQLDNEGVDALAELLTVNSNIAHIDLFNYDVRDIGSESLERLYSALFLNSSLLFLDISIANVDEPVLYNNVIRIRAPVIVNPILMNPIVANHPRIQHRRDMQLMRERYDKDIKQLINVNKLFMFEKRTFQSFFHAVRDRYHDIECFRNIWLRILCIRKSDILASDLQ